MITNPLWQREINISKVRIELIMQDLQEEINNGAKVYRQEAGQLSKPQQEVRVIPSAVNGEEQNQNIDAGADPNNPVPA